MLSTDENTELSGQGGSDLEAVEHGQVSQLSDTKKEEEEKEERKRRKGGRRGESVRRQMRGIDIAEKE